MTDTAAETKSMGLLADARGVMVFAESLINYTMICNFCPIYRDWQKPRHRDTDGNCPYHRAVNNNTSGHHDIRLPALQIILFTLTRKLFTVFKFVARRSTALLFVSYRGDKFCFQDSFMSQPLTFANALIKNWLPATFC